LAERNAKLSAGLPLMKKGLADNTTRFKLRYGNGNVSLLEMKSIIMNKIDMGGQLPEFTLQVGVSETINLPSDIESDYAVILFYRGHW
jgi:hypothetical protein